MKTAKTAQLIGRAKRLHGPLFFSLLVLLVGSPQMPAQTNLANGSWVSGNFTVGDATKGNLLINGKTGGSAGNNLHVVGEGRVIFNSPGDDAGFVWDPTTGSIQVGGYYTYPSAGLYSVAGGSSMASGDYSVALGVAMAYGNYSVALGGFAGADGYSSVAIGDMSVAEGAYSISLGGWATGTASFSTPFGHAYGQQSISLSGSAEGDYSAAIGFAATAKSVHSMALGRYNIIEGNETTWVDTDPLFVIGNGNGTSAGQRRNALVVLKNGKVNIFGSSPSTAAIVLDPLTPQITVDGQALLVPNGSGNVGIGTASPGAKLDVRGNLSVGNSTTAIFTANTTTGKVGVGGSANPDYRMTVTGGLFSYGQFLVHNNLFQDGGNWVSFNSISGGFYVASNGVNVLSIPSAGAGSGNVGIGTGAPAAKLQVVGPSSSPNNAFFVTTNTWTTGSAGSGVRIGTGATSGNTYGVLDVLQAGGTSANGVLAVNPQGGNVGIGTTTPTAKLEVSGDTKLSGNLSVTGRLRVAQQGDLSMGDFTAEP